MPNNKGTGHKVYTPDDVRRLRKTVHEQIQKVREDLNELDGDGFEAFIRFKFSDFGYHPVDEHSWDFIEQLNQTFHCLAVLAGAEILMKMDWFPKGCGLSLELTTGSGIDIRSDPAGVVEAEVFATKNPKNNDKLHKDVKTMADSSVAKHRYVFFFAPSYHAGPQHDARLNKELKRAGGKVEIWALAQRQLMSRAACI